MAKKALCMQAKHPCMKSTGSQSAVLLACTALQWLVKSVMHAILGQQQCSAALAQVQKYKQLQVNGIAAQSQTALSTTIN
jgi:hypothetical protein